MLVHCWQQPKIDSLHLQAMVWVGFGAFGRGSDYWAKRWDAAYNAEQIKGQLGEGKRALYISLSRSDQQWLFPNRMPRVLMRLEGNVGRLQDFCVDLFDHIAQNGEWPARIVLDVEHYHHWFVSLHQSGDWHVENLADPDIQAELPDSLKGYSPEDFRPDPEKVQAWHPERFDPEKHVGSQQARDAWNQFVQQEMTRALWRVVAEPAFAVFGHWVPTSNYGDTFHQRQITSHHAVAIPSGAVRSTASPVWYPGNDGGVDRAINLLEANAEQIPGEQIVPWIDGRHNWSSMKKYVDRCRELGVREFLAFNENYDTKQDQKLAELME